MRLEVRLLGELALVADGERVSLPSSRKARAVLAYLSVTPGGASRDELCHLLFADTEDPRGALRWVISRLRAAVKDRQRELLISEGGQLLLSGPVSTDLDRLEVLVGGEAAEVAELVSFGRSLDGGFLDGLELDGHPEFEAWRLAEGARCQELHKSLLRRLVGELRYDQQAVDFARRLVNLDAADETSWALLIEQLNALRQFNDAKKVFDRARRELAREGVPMSGLLRDALERREPRARREPALAPRRHERPTLTVLPCDPGGALDTREAREMTAAISTAASRGGLVQLLMPAADNAAREADLELHSYAFLSGDALELRAQLVQRATGASLYGWEVTLRSGAEESLPEQVIAYFASHLEFDVIIALIGVAREKPEAERTAQDLFLLALPLIYSAEGVNIEQVLRTLDAANAADPSFGPSLCAAAWARSGHPDYNSQPEEIARSSRLARKAIELCQDDPFVLGWAAAVLTHTDLDVVTADDLARRALKLNPYSPMALIGASYTAHYAGEVERSLGYLDLVDELDAAGPLAFLCYTCRALNYYQLGQAQDAERWCRRSLGHNPTFIVTLRTLAAALVQQGRHAEAADVARQMVAIDASENLEFFRARSPYQQPEARERLCADLAAAGLPEWA